uniref:Ig-like domain-containing protein n=1 Tax=Dicentrarchus labrax TaxID=13489 RepID=A0A8C4GXZ1_DICLA
QCSVLLVCSFPTGSSLSDSVFQTPPFIIKRVGESVVSGIKCSHTITSYQVILWYKQDERKPLQFLGYLNVNFPYPEEDVKEKISFDGNGQKYSNLNISSVSLNDSGVYFCAASRHSASDSPQVNTKTLLYLPADRQHVESLNTCSQPPSKPSLSRFHQPF